MTIFARMFSRLRTGTTARGTTQHRSRVLTFQPLEERRLLAAVPNNFLVVNFVDTGITKEVARGHESEIKLTWVDNGATGGYEIQSSINGLDGAAGLWQSFETVPAGENNITLDRFRALYFRIQSIPPDDPAVWSAVIDIDSRPRYDAEDGTVKVSAIAHSQIDVPLIAATIELRWPLELAYEDADYTIYRKEKDALSFTLKDTLTYNGLNPITGWTDENLASKTAYEYQVERQRKHDASPSPNLFFTFALTATGYVYAGVDVPLSDADSTIESPGTVILVIDETQKVALATELDRLEDDLFAEGWDVAVVDDVNPADTIESVRDKIFEIWDAPGADVTAVFLIGHVPVPMSGNSNPDGHEVRPMPADVFYGDMDSDWALGTNADGASAVFAIDLDGDGDADVLSASAGDGTIAWYENDGGEKFTKRSIDADAEGASAVFAIDLDSDGDIDVLSASFHDNTIAWYENDGSGGFTKRTITTIADGANAVFAIDLDGDGDVDVLSASVTDDTIAWYENDGSQGFTRHVITEDPDGVGTENPMQGFADSPQSVYAVDVNGDGYIDVLSASIGSGGKIAWYENDGSEGFTEHTIGTSTPNARSVFAIDVNGDGDVDVLSAFSPTRGGTFAWYENGGGLTPSFETHEIETDVKLAFSVYAIDVDGDGDVDVLGASADDDTIAWYEHDGSEGFTREVIATDPDLSDPQINGPADGPKSVFAIDVDGDGDVDVLSASVNDDGIAWYENDGDQGFTWHTVSVNLSEDTVPDDPPPVAPAVSDDKPVELMVGRVDMRNLPDFSNYDPDMTETELLRRYLDKDHAFRTGQVAVERKARIQNYLGTSHPQEFVVSSNSSTGAWQTLSGLFGPADEPDAAAPDNIDVSDWSDTTWDANGPSDSFLWGHASAFGRVWGFNNHVIMSSETLAAPDGVPVVTQKDNGENGTKDGVDNSTVFTSFFGSRIMEWQKTDSVMRSVLADEGYGLTATWGGTGSSGNDWGNMYYQHMSLGETVGAGLLNTQNQQAYDSSGTGVFVSLLGDPTLRMFVVRPPGEVSRAVHMDNVTVDVSWTASPDADVSGYRIYRSTAAGEPFECLTDVTSQCVTTSATTMSYTDDAGSTAYTYMVRAVKTETTGGGSFVNLSAGVYQKADSIADLNSDGTVDFEDLTVLFANWGQAGNVPGNIVDPENTTVNFDDQVLLLALWTGPVGAGAGNPHVSAVTPAGAATVFSTSIDIVVTFNEAVPGIDASALRLFGLGATEATVGTPTTSDDITWTFGISGLRAGQVGVGLGLIEGSIQDVQGNNATPIVWSFDAEVGLVLNEAGTDDVALIPNFLGFSSDYVTVEVTFASQTMPSGGVPLFAYATDAYADAFTLFVDTASPFNMTLYVNGVGKVLHSGQDVLDLFDGVKRHLAVTFDSLTGPNATAVAYIDGEVFGTSQTFADDVGVDKGLDDLGGTFFLGQEPDVEDPDDYLFDVNQIFKGSILEVRVYDEVRDATEIVDDMDDPLNLASLPAELVDAWEFRGAGGLVSGLDMLGGKHFEMSNQGVGLLLNEGQATQDSALVTDFSGFSSNLLTVELTFAADEREITSELITPLISYATGQQPTAFMLYVQKSGSKLRFKVNGSSTLTLFEGAIVKALFDGAPHHIALTYNASTSKVQVFLDGTPKTVKDVPGNPGTAVAGGVFALGQDPDNEDENDEYGFDPTQIFSREISDVRIYDEVRSAAQIQLDMITPLDPAALPASLAHAWQMRVGSDLTSGADIVGGKHLVVSTNSYGVRFPSDGDFAKAAAYNGFSSQQVTVEMTFSHDPLSAGAVVPLLSYGTTTNAHAFTVIAEEDTINGDKLSLFVNGVQQTLVQGEVVTDLFDGGIHHLALAWNSENGVVAVYVDGALVGSASFDPGAVESGGTFLLGQRISGFIGGDPIISGEDFSGVIYEVRVYDDVRTQEQILIDMVTPLDALDLPAGLVNGWQFLVSGGVPSGADITGGDDLFLYYFI